MTRNQRSSYYVLWYIHAPNHLGDVYPLVNLNQDESRASLENWLPNHRFLFQVGVLVCPGNNLSPSHANAITPMKKFCQPQDKDMLLSHIDTPKSKQRPNMSSQKEKMTLSTFNPALFRCYVCFPGWAVTNLQESPPPIRHPVQPRQPPPPWRQHLRPRRLPGRRIRTVARASWVALVCWGRGGLGEGFPYKIPTYFFELRNHFLRICCPNIPGQGLQFHEFLGIRKLMFLGDRIQ